MRPYQLEGLNWMIRLYEHGINGILADEMGLGKTLQTISLLGHLKENCSIDGPHLIIVPKSTLGNWGRELNKWCPSLRTIRFHGDKAERAKVVEEYLEVSGSFDVLVTTYEVAISEKGPIGKLVWKYLIIDEAHRIKNEESRLSQVVRTFNTYFRLLITGTPLQNNLHELWSMLNFLLPDVFASAEQFDEWFNPEGGSDGESQADVLAQLHRILRPFLLRRLKQDVEKDLPPKKEMKLLIGMTEMQRTWYASILTKNIDVLNAMGAQQKRMLNILMQLRKCANHPYLFEGAEQPPFTNDERLIENSGKMTLLDKLLLRLHKEGHRVLIFSQMTRMLDILEDYCQFREWQYCRIDGSTSGEAREEAMDSFNQPKSEKFIFMLSTRAGGLGINLATADTVIIYDSDWNPQMDLQAMDRAHRIGQTREVMVYRFMIEGSVEEKIIDRAQKKLFLDAAVIQQGRLADQSKALSKEEMLSMIRFGADAVFHSKGCDPSEQDIDAILARGAERTRLDSEKLKSSTMNLANFTLDGAEKSLYDYDGQDWSAGGEAAKAWTLSLPKRVTKQNYDENDYYRSMLSTRGEGRQKLPKQMQISDFQFFDTERLNHLRQKELRHMQAQQVRAGLEDAGVPKKANQLAASEAESPPLTIEEEEEKQELLRHGFSTWNRRDFNAFVRGCEFFGRRDLASITHEVEGKSEKEVAKYASVFFERFRELKDWEKVMRRIENGEAKIHRRGQMMNAFGKKVSTTKNPWLTLKLNYGSSGVQGKRYTEENDRFLVCMTNQLGYGRWAELQREVRNAPIFRFDWFMRTRTAAELAHRVERLALLVEEEMGVDDENGADEAERKRKRNSGAGSTTAPGSAASSKRSRRI